MKEASGYLSEKFKLEIWPEFAKTLTNKRSRDNYFNMVCMLCDYAEVDYLQLKPKQVQKYFDLLTHPVSDGKKLSHTTIQSRLSAFRSISTYIINNMSRFGMDESSYSNIFMYIDVPDVDVYIKKEDIPTIDELNRILIAAGDDPMMSLIFAMVIRCGFAASEICKMKVKQIAEDLNNNFSVVFQEKDKKRYVKLPKDLVDYLLHYKKYMSISQEYMFYNKKGLVLKVRNLESLVDKYVSLAGITKKYTIQDLRNAAICYLKASGADDIDIAKCMGIEARWMYRYDHVVEEIKLQPVDLGKIRVVL